MFTGIVTAVTIFLGIGITSNVIKDKSGETKKAVKKVVGDAVKWPKDLYDKYKDTI